METLILGEKMNFRMLTTNSNHYGIEIGLATEEAKEIMFMEGIEADEEMAYKKVEEVVFAKGKDPLDSYKAIRRVHEVTSHKSADQMIRIYRNAGLMGPGVVNVIKRVIRECKVCQKFGKSMVKPKIAMPKAGSFN